MTGNPGIWIRCWAFLGLLWKKSQKDEVLFLASGLAFNVLICMLPLLLLLMFWVGYLLQSSDSLSFVDKILITAFPNQPHAITIQRWITGILTEVVSNRKSFGMLSVVVLVLISTTLFSSMRTVLHQVYEIREKRHMLVTYLLDLVLVLGSTLLIISTTLMRSILRTLKNFAHNIPGMGFLDYSFLVGLIAAGVTILVILALCYLMYRYVPARRTPKNMAWVSAVTTTCLWEVAGRAFSFYLSTFKVFSKTYGAYAFMIVLLIWIFYSCLVFVLGAEVGKIWCGESKETNEDQGAG